MGRSHTGYDVYLGTPDTDPSEHALAFSDTIIHEDTHAKVIKVKTKNPNRTWGVVYTLTYEGVMQRNGTALRWAGTDAEGNPVVVSGVAVKGGCISCSRR